MIKSYLITDPLFYTSDPKTVLKKLLHVKMKYCPDYICLRDKQSLNYPLLAQSIVDSSLKDVKTKLFLHTDFKLTFELGCDDVHLPSNALGMVAKAKDFGLDNSPTTIKNIISKNEILTIAVKSTMVFNFLLLTIILNHVQYVVLVLPLNRNQEQ